MGQLIRFIAQVVSVSGIAVRSWDWLRPDGVEVTARNDLFVPAESKLVIYLKRKGPPYCPDCGRRCRKIHDTCQQREWKDLPWGTHQTILRYAPVRVKCRRCNSTPVEWLAWADPHQRETIRFQQTLTLLCASMPVSHVAAMYGMGWDAVKRAEKQSLKRWDEARDRVELRMVGIDEKYLGRRGAWSDRYITIISNLETGEPVWTGFGRSQTTVEQWLATLTDAEKANIKLFASDMHAPFQAAIKADPALCHVAWVHDPFHVIKRANKAVEELRREIFFRAGSEMRAIGKGKRWLVLRAWEKCTPEQRAQLRKLFSYNPRLAHAYQILEQLRTVLKAPDKDSMTAGLKHVLARLARRTNIPMRKLHDSLKSHWDAIVELGEHHPPTGRIEALNNNWEALVRRGRGYRDLAYLLLKLRFMVSNPIHNTAGVQRFLALNLPVPARRVA